MIGEKIISIMSEIKPIEKTELDEEKNYKFAKSEEIIAMVKPLLVKYKVIILPIKVTSFIPQGNKIFLTMKYQFIDIESQEKDTIEVEIPGSGYDEKGRAVYAALTGAYRYAMQEVFAIPVVDEIKNENSKLDDENKDDTNENINNEVIEDSQELENFEEIPVEDLESLFACEKVS